MLWLRSLFLFKKIVIYSKILFESKLLNLFFSIGNLGSVHIKSKSKIKAREIVEIKIESSLS